MKTKTDIIRAVAYCNVPEGAQLIQKSHASGVRVSSLGPDEIKRGAGKMLYAGMVEEVLSTSTEKLRRSPDSAFFQKIHESALHFRDDLEHHIVMLMMKINRKAEYDVTVSKIQEIATEMGITYTAPQDPLAK